MRGEDRGEGRGGEEDEGPKEDTATPNSPEWEKAQCIAQPAMERGLWHPLLPRWKLHLIHARDRAGLFTIAIARGRNVRRPGRHCCYGEDIREVRGRHILPPEEFGLRGVLSVAGVVRHEGMGKWSPVNGPR